MSATLTFTVQDAMKVAPREIKVETDTHGCVIHCEGVKQYLVLDLAFGKLRVFVGEDENLTDQVVAI